MSRLAQKGGKLRALLMRRMAEPVADDLLTTETDIVQDLRAQIADLTAERDAANAKLAAIRHVLDQGE